MIKSESISKQPATSNQQLKLINPVMKNKTFIFILPLVLLISCQNKYTPLSLHPDNQHYFLFRGKPTILIGSTEHYGAVMNLDFDYIRYLDELSNKGLNVTRTFSGVYVEPQGAFGIAKNTLAPAKEKFICPWARSNLPGYPGGGNKFDLTKWDEAYFERLKDFIAEAGKRNIVVELDLFSNFYDTLQWKLSPLHCKNNINNVEAILDQKEVLSLRHPGILKIQEEMVRKILTVCNGLDNLYYEVCNEPYFGDLKALDSWEKHMADVIADAENMLPHKHLISQNIQNGSFKIENPHPAVSIFNFHYAKPPVTVEMNYGLNKPIGDNETGFNGIEDVHYRTEAWDFITAGGALFNNLDYSFTAGNEDGSFVVTPGQPGGGGITLRNQLKILKTVFGEIDFIHMKPSDYLLKNSPEGNSTMRILAEEGEQYLLYLNNSKVDKGINSESNRDNGTTFEISIELSAGDYKGEWIDTESGLRTPFPVRDHKGGPHNFKTPPVGEDLALKITR
jgi:hypothetical protein